MVKVVGVLVVEKNSLFREGLTRIVPKGKFRIVASAAAVAESPPLPEAEPVMLLGASENSNTTAAEIRAFKNRHPDGKVLVLESALSVEEISLAFAAGAMGCVSQVAGPSALIWALELLAAGEKVLISPRLDEIVLGRKDRDLQVEAGQSDGAEGCNRNGAHKTSCVPPLSPRERFVLRLLVQGSSNKAIARQIGVTEATVKVHVKSILRKVRVQNRLQAAIWATQSGIWGADEASVPDGIESDDASRLSLLN
jgi:two-component system, NarL family, nitrate/nitrite response regulator NarL